MSRSGAMALVAAIALVVGGAAYLIQSGLQAPPVAAPPTVPSTVQPATVGPLHGAGIVRGEVTITGTPPTMPDLKRGSDPACSATSAKDEQVLVAGDRIANVVVRLVNAPASAPPPDAVIIDQKDCMYRPRVQVAIAGQPLLIRNDDGTLHNVHSYENGKTIFNNAQPPKSDPIRRTFDHAATIKLKCDVHPWMTGYVVVSSNPFFAVTGADGSFEITGIPAGVYTLEAWHEKFGTKTASVTVSDQVPAKLTVAYSADDRGS